MKNRFVVLGVGIVIALAVAIPALAGSSDQARKSASVKTTANKALKKAKKANQRLNALDLKTIYYAVVEANGTLARGTQGTSSSQVATGLYQVNFPQSISQCAWVTSIGGSAGVPVPPGETHSSLQPGSTTALLQQISNSAGVLADRPFHVIVTCA
jgi:type II secretory pathway pseudopilin PulG